MLKPSDPDPGTAGPGEDRPVGELVHRLVEDGKSYAKAEVGLVKAIASHKASLAALPAALLGGALVLAIAGASALAVGLALELARLVGPLLGGLLSFLLFAAVAGGIAWVAVQRLRRDL